MLVGLLGGIISLCILPSGTIRVPFGLLHTRDSVIPTSLLHETSREFPVKAVMIGELGIKKCLGLESEVR